MLAGVSAANTEAQQQQGSALSQLEQQLAGLVPMATGRLQALGDMAALGMADVVSDTVRKVR